MAKQKYIKRDFSQRPVLSVVHELNHKLARYLVPVYTSAIVQLRTKDEWHFFSCKIIRRQVSKTLIYKTIASIYAESLFINVHVNERRNINIILQRCCLEDIILFQNFTRNALNIYWNCLLWTFILLLIM